MNDDMDTGVEGRPPPPLPEGPPKPELKPSFDAEELAR